MKKPCILIFENVGGTNAEILQEVAAGVEEEGMLYDLLPCKRLTTAASMAAAAASESPFGCGIGVDAETIVLSVASLPNKPLFSCGLTKTAARALGQNAARYVKKEPFLEERDFI